MSEFFVTLVYKISIYQNKFRYFKPSQVSTLEHYEPDTGFMDKPYLEAVHKFIKLGFQQP